MLTTKTKTCFWRNRTIIVVFRMTSLFQIQPDTRNLFQMGNKNEIVLYSISNHIYTHIMWIYNDIYIYIYIDVAYVPVRLKIGQVPRHRSWALSRCTPHAMVWSLALISTTGLGLDRQSPGPNRPSPRQNRQGNILQWIEYPNPHNAWRSYIRMTHDYASWRTWCIMMHRDGSWFIVLRYDASWCTMMHHDASWSIRIHHDASWGTMMHREASWPFTIHHDAPSSSCIEVVPEVHRPKIMSE